LPVVRAQQFVEHNLARPIDVAMLARAAQLSRAHFVRMFTATVGTPPSDYVFASRIDRAMRMLLATDNPINAIASACGFADANYFSKAFKRAKGCSPGAFRTAARNGAAVVTAEPVAALASSTSPLQNCRTKGHAETDPVLSFAHLGGRR
jgi:transcriptional regulator GlxA family with amidase domain